MKAIHRRSTVEVVDLDAAPVDEIKLTNLAGGLFGTDKPRVHLVAQEMHEGEVRYGGHYASTTLDDMPAELLDALKAWAQSHIDAQIAREVSEHVAKTKEAA